MRDLTIYIFVITIISIIIGGLFLLPKIHHLSKLNLLDNKYRETNECELKIEQQQMEIEKYLNIMQLSYIVFILTLIDTSFIYERSLLEAYLNDKTLICRYKDSDIVVNNKLFTYSNKNSLIPSGQITNKDNNITIGLDMCKIKNKRWWE